MLIQNELSWGKFTFDNKAQHNKIGEAPACFIYDKQHTLPHFLCECGDAV